MRAECQFAKAGQGLFYNGLLVDHKGRTFSFVYDCGTSDADVVLEHSISEYKEFAGKRLDLLAISHFHCDHISHIPKLINGLELGTVVIPFIKPELRLLIAAQYEGIENDDERIRLYDNPEMYFMAHGAESVLVASSVENNNEDMDFFGEPNNDFPHKDSETKESYNRTIVFGRNNTYSYDTNPFENSTSEYLGCFSIVASSYQWEFRFKNLHYDKMQDDFWDDISKLLELHNNSFDEILKNKTYTKQLRRIYENNFEGGRDKLNDTSLMLLSRPLQRGLLVDNFSHKGCVSVDSAECNDESHNRWLKYGQASTLLLGDLSVNCKIFDRYLQRLEKPLSQLMRVIQLPHHGAKMKHNPFYCEFCHDLRHRSHLPISLVASYGIRNNYGHPDLSCCTNCRPDDLFWQNTHIELVNERKDFTYTIIY